ncbi:hypothetical protein HZA40_01130, partial [Candidatus Peregrinibacteria bacterium]|nr:hypothetical protein [Candidatus Peregrinibacteria bacterium]
MRKYFHKLFGLSAMMRRAFAALLIMAIFANTVFAVTFTVNNNGDASDATPGNGICATSGAVCTLRAAIEEANALAGTDTINFSSGSLTLTPGSTMTISSNLTIDGSTAGMGNNIALNGQGSASFAALTLDGSSDGSTVKQLYIYGFNGASGRGISIQSGAGSNTLPVTIGSGTSGEGNVLGLQTDGTTVSANRIGIESAGTNIVFKNNVVSGSTLAGISLGNGSKDIILDRNCVGSNKDCNAAKANGGAGIEVAGSAVSLNGGDGGTEGLIIGETIALGNTVVGNNGAGIAIGDSTGSIAGTIKIQGNKIGEVASGAIGNGSHGIFVEKDASTANITIGVDGDGTNDSSEGNIIGGNTGDGIRVLEGSSVVIAGNQDGMYNSTAHGNTGAGITIGNSTDWPTTVTIGSNNDGTSDNDEKNSIGSNVAGGISIGNAVTATITGNYVGSDSSGNSLPNTGFGIKVSAPQLTTLNIGKGTSLSSAYSNNYVNYNAAGGNGAISIENTASGASAKIKATFIGVADNLFASAANSLTGLYLTAPANFTIGTEFDGSNDSYEGNFISNNVGNGIYIGNGVLSAIIAGNKIGVAAASAYSTTYTTAAGNGTGAATGSKNGIKVDSNSITSLTIGGVDSTQRNYIDSNLENGISLINMPAPALAYIYNNYIGLGSNGTTDLGNVNNGIYIAPTTAGVSINVGGTSTNQGNVISGNAGNGISLAGSLFLVLNIRQNIIGLVAAATSKVANDLAGISLQNNSATVNIGDGASTGRNVIGGNTSYGIGITGGDVGIEGNYFGLASDGTTAVADGNNEINAVSTSGSISALMIGHAGGENRFYDLARLAVFIKDIVPANETGSTYLETDNQW